MIIGSIFILFHNLNSWQYDFSYLSSFSSYLTYMKIYAPLQFFIRMIILTLFFFFFHTHSCIPIPRRYSYDAATIVCLLLPWPEAKKKIIKRKWTIDNFIKFSAKSMYLSYVQFNKCLLCYFTCESVCVLVLIRTTTTTMRLLADVYDVRFDAVEMVQYQSSNLYNVNAEEGGNFNYSISMIIR